jgi:hypothetical protein
MHPFFAPKQTSAVARIMDGRPQFSVEMMNSSFRDAKLARKRRTKWWRGHIPLVYATIAVAFIVIGRCVGFVDQHIPQWLKTLGVSPSAVSLITGTLSCGFGIWGLRTMKGQVTAWVVIYALCLLGGILSLAKAFSFI